MCYRTLPALLLLAALAACAPASSPTATRAPAGGIAASSPTPPPSPTPLPSPTPTPPSPTPLPSAAAIAKAAAAATVAASSLRFDLVVAGRPIYADKNQLARISGAQGVIRRPSDGMATVSAQTLLGALKIQIIAVGGKRYMTDPLNGTWQCVTDDSVPNIGALLDGIASAAGDQLSDAQLVGDEEVAGAMSHHIRGTVADPPGDLLRGPLTIDLWSDVVTGRLSRIVLSEQQTSGGSATWTATFGGYNEPVTIDAPTACP